MRYSLGFSAMICCLLLFQSHPALANDAPVILHSGGAQVLTGPLTVRMESEVVRITLGEQSYVVDSTFNFRNTGQKIEFDVGFPKNGEGWIDDRFSHTADFIKFETWVNGQPVNFIEQPNMARIEGGYTLPDLIKSVKKTEDISQLRLTAIDKRWMVKERVQFPSNKITTTRVRYEAPYNSASPCKGTMGYIYGTGNYWNGNIGKSTFIVDSTRIPKGDRPKDIYISDEPDRQKAKITTPGVGIIQCVIQDYKPLYSSTTYETDSGSSRN